jgi:hypothetical protein
MRSLNDNIEGEDHYKKRVIFFEKGFFRLIAGRGLGFFIETVERFKTRWVKKRTRYLSKYEKRFGPVLWPLLIAVKHGYVKFAAILIQANHPIQLAEDEHCTHLTTLVKSFDMFKLLIEAGVEFKFSLDYWPDVPFVSYSHSDKCITEEWIQYIFQNVKNPIEQDGAYEIIKTQILPKLVDHYHSRASIRLNIFKILTIIVQHVGAIRISSDVLYWEIFDYWDDINSDVYERVARMLSFLGLLRISDTDSFYGITNVYKLSVQSHSFVDALIEQEFFSKEEEEEEEER